MCLSADSKCQFGPSDTVHLEISDLCSAYLKIVGELIYCYGSRGPHLIFPASLNRLYALFSFLFQ